MSMSLVLCYPGGGGQQIMQLRSAEEVTATFSIADGITGSFTLKMGTRECNAIQTGAHDVKIFNTDTGEMWGRARIITSNASGLEDREKTFNFVGYKQWLQRLNLWAADVPVTSGYSGMDLEAAGWALITLAQSRLGGIDNLNITRAGSAVGRFIIGTKIFDAGTSLRDALDDLSQSESTAGADDAWEWDIVGENDDLVYYAWAPRRGKATYDPLDQGSGGTADFFFDNHAGVIDFTEDFDITNYANFITVQGKAGTNERYIFGGGSATAGNLFVHTGKPINNPTLFITNGDFNIGFSESQLSIQNKFEYIYGQGNVTVTGPDTLNAGGHTYYVDFNSGTLAFKPISPPITGTFTTQNLTGPSGSVSLPGLTGGTPANYSFTRNQIGSTYTYQVSKSDYYTTPYGVVEHYHYDDSLTDTTSIQQRANYLLRVMSTYNPALGFTYDSSQYEGKSDFWIGDYVVIDMEGDGYRVYRTDLRIVEFTFSNTEDGDMDISVTTDIYTPIDNTATNLGKRVAAADAKAAATAAATAAAKAKTKAALNKQLVAAQKNETALKKQWTAQEKYYHTHGNHKIDKGAERNKLNAIDAAIAKSKLLQKNLKAQISKLK